MICGAMAVQEEHGTSGSVTSLSQNEKISMDMGIPNVRGIQLKEQLTGDDLAPKVRKPYTITKQRERWTEEEHKKFLEALKLYGRAWRKIEEHVGTKTAVQIRSHAQKFFTKVVRESNTGDSTSVKPIEIPPPRPKRKPMHPYPRKLVSPTSNGISMLEKPTRSASPNLSVLEQENQSPTSVLSAVGSDASAGVDSSTPYGSVSPVPNGSSEEARSSSPEENSSLDEQITLRLEPLSQTNAVKQESQESSGSQCLKLFGKTLLVKDGHEPSHDLELGTSKPVDGNECCTLPWTVIPLKFPTCNYLIGQSANSERMSGISSTQSIIDGFRSKDSFSPVPLTWLTLCGNASSSTPDVHSPTPIKAKPMRERKENLDKDEKEGSSTGSNSDCDADSSSPFSVEKKIERSFLSHKLSKRISADSVDGRKGFVPYKRCLTKQDSVLSSTETNDERAKQRVRLCL